MQIFSVNDNFFAAVFHILFSGLAAKGGYLAFQITHPGFAHIFPHNQGDGIPGNFQRALF